MTKKLTEFHENDFAFSMLFLDSLALLGNHGPLSARHFNLGLLLLELLFHIGANLFDHHFCKGLNLRKKSKIELASIIAQKDEEISLR